MKPEELKVGYPIYYIKSTKLTFENTIIDNIKRINTNNHEVYRIKLIQLNAKKYIYTEFTDVQLDDIVYLTKDEYDNRISEIKSGPGVTTYEYNYNYWNCHNKELRKIKLNAVIYRIKKILRNIYEKLDNI